MSDCYLFIYLTFQERHPQKRKEKEQITPEVKFATFFPAFTRKFSKLNCIED